MVHVCIVEDDPDIRATLRLLLDDAGCTYCEASDGGAALDLLRTSRQPLVVLLDLMLPVMNGLQVLEALATDAAAGPRHAYILLTAKRDIELPPPGLGERFPLMVIQKPFDIDDVLDAIQWAEQQLTPR